MKIIGDRQFLDQERLNVFRDRKMVYTKRELVVTPPTTPSRQDVGIPPQKIKMMSTPVRADTPRGTYHEETTDITVADPDCCSMIASLVSSCFGTNHRDWNS